MAVKSTSTKRKAKAKPAKKSPAKTKTANKTVATKASVKAFIDAIPNQQTQQDCKTLSRMMRNATGKRARMWGASIVGFGEYHYQYASGREGDFMVVGYSPRAQNLSIYIMPGFEPYAGLLKKLGKHKTARSCLYIKRLSDVDEQVLEAIISRSVADMKKKYATDLK